MTKEKNSENRKEFVENVKKINNFIVLSLYFSKENTIYSAVRFQKLYFLFIKEFDFKFKESDLEQTNLFIGHHYGPYSEDFKKGLSLLKRKDIITIKFENKFTQLNNLSLVDIDAINDSNEYIKYILDSKQLEDIKKFIHIFKEKYKLFWEDFEMRFKQFVSKINDLNINTLLLYVYKEYPDYIKNSKIRNEVLSEKK